MSTNNNQEKFFKELEELRESKEYNNISGAERALILLLLDEKENIYIPDDDPNWFHKQFRQIDVTSSGMRDSAIWNLINDSEIIWKALDKVYPNEQKANFMNIYQLLPNAKKYSIAIDERGIVLEGPVDPECMLTFEEICLIYHLTDKMIDAFLEEKFEKIKDEEIYNDTKREH
jgi:hypothetical protein